jgi:hypothetical protein
MLTSLLAHMCWAQDEWVPDSEEAEEACASRPRRATATYSQRGSRRNGHVYNTRASGNRTLLQERCAQACCGDSLLVISMNKGAPPYE